MGKRKADATVQCRLLVRKSNTYAASYTYPASYGDTEAYRDTAANSPTCTSRPGEQTGGHHSVDNYI